jgi:hypothetical protein
VLAPVLSGPKTEIRPTDPADPDAGIQDKVRGKDLYRAIIGEMPARLNRGRAGRR